ncbi:hypothetical protein FRC08_013199 [Ceratobasidium sp. 394]|nr:hypothetical protein FRC08_013199 [Ceratobasidium sp. 394]
MNVVESQEFRRVLILTSRAPNLRDEDIPRQKMATKSIGKLYNEEMARIKHELQNARGRSSVTSDLWSNNALSVFMAATAHYINSEGYLAEHLIEFRRIKGHHTGANVGNVSFSVFEEFDIV